MADKSLNCASVTVACAIAAALLALPAAAYGQQPNRSGCVTRYNNGKPYIFCVSKKRAWRRAPSAATAQPPSAPTAAPSAPRFEMRRFETVVPPSAPAAPMTSSGPRAAPPPPAPSAGAPRNGGPAAGAAAPVTAAPSRSIAVGAAPARVRAVRALIEPAEMPPREVAGYGIVAFTTRPISQDIERYKLICEAYKATLMAQSELPANTPLSEQMVTYWPIADKNTPEAQRGDCTHLVSNYALRLGLDAIQDADKQAEGLASRRGPFLIAWAPSESRFKPDALVLVMDLSALDSARSFIEVFQDWRQHITDKPELWRRGGFDIESVRRIIHDTFDRYGDGLLRLISSK